MYEAKVGDRSLGDEFDTKREALEALGQFWLDNSYLSLGDPTITRVED